MGVIVNKCYKIHIPTFKSRLEINNFLLRVEADLGVKDHCSLSPLLTFGWCRPEDLEYQTYFLVIMMKNQPTNSVD